MLGGGRSRVAPMGRKQAAEINARRKRNEKRRAENPKFDPSKPTIKQRYIAARASMRGNHALSDAIDRAAEELAMKKVGSEDVIPIMKRNSAIDARYRIKFRHAPQHKHEGLRKQMEAEKRTAGVNARARDKSRSDEGIASRKIKSSEDTAKANREHVERLDKAKRKQEVATENARRESEKANRERIERSDKARRKQEVATEERLKKASESQGRLREYTVRIRKLTDELAFHRSKPFQDRNKINKVIQNIKALDKQYGYDLYLGDGDEIDGGNDENLYAPEHIFPKGFNTVYKTPDDVDKAMIEGGYMDSDRKFTKDAESSPGIIDMYKDYMLHKFTPAQMRAYEAEKNPTYQTWNRPPSLLQRILPDALLER